MSSERKGGGESVGAGFLRWRGIEREAYGSESKRVHFDTESCDVLLLELASKVTLDESGL